MRIVVARTTFHAPETYRQAVTEGSLWDADHPVVKAHPDLFVDAETVAAPAPGGKTRKPRKNEDEAEEA